MSRTISVVIPVYNRFERVKYAVNSVLAQTLPVCEIILVDDGSIDGTSELLLSYLQRTSAWRDRVRYFRQDNQGPNIARNVGITNAKGDWLAFNDNDDLWLPEKLEWQFKTLDAFGDCEACITDAWFMNNPRMKMTLFQLARKTHSGLMGTIRNPLTYMLNTDSALGVHPIWLQNLVVKADLARRIGGFDPALRFGDDDDFAFRLGCETPFCFVNLPLVLIDRTPQEDRHIGASKNWDQVEFRLTMAQQRYEKRFRLSGCLPGEVRKRIRRDLAGVHSGWANWFLQRHEYVKARQAIAEAARVYLSRGIAIKWALSRWTPSIARKLTMMRAEYRNRGYVGIG